jgi:hypothetical protein
VPTSEYYDFRTLQKENLKMHSELKQELSGLETPRPESKHFAAYSPHHKTTQNVGNFEPQIIFDPQRDQKKKSNMKILSF